MSRSPPAEPEKVRNLIALDAENLIRRLRIRRPEIISVFSRSRDREVLIRTLRSWFEEADAQALLTLEPEQQSAVSAFYEAVESLRFYFQYTEDMPGTVDRTLTARLAELEAHYVRLTRAIAGPVPVELDDLQDVTPRAEATRPPDAVVDAEVVETSERPRRDWAQAPKSAAPKKAPARRTKKAAASTPKKAPRSAKR